MNIPRGAEHFLNPIARILAGAVAVIPAEEGRERMTGYKVTNNCNIANPARYAFSSRSTTAASNPSGNLPDRIHGIFGRGVKEKRDILVYALTDKHKYHGTPDQ